MALPKKGLRKIVVGGNKYAWSATGNDGGLGLSIIPFKNDGQILTSTFEYHLKQTSETVLENGSTINHLKQQFKITPF